MNFKEAVQNMEMGFKVRLPEWKGFWFLSAEADGIALDTIDSFKPYIRVYTKDGETLDTPHFDKYEHRDDWEIASE